MLRFVGWGRENPQQVRGDKIHENELLSDTVELALTYKDNIERGSGECVISSKWQCKSNDGIIFVKHGGTCSEIIYNRILISKAEMPWLVDRNIS